MSSSRAVATLDRRASVYRSAAGGSPSTEPKFPCPSTKGAALAGLARTAFVSGMDLGLLTGAIVAVAAGLLALATLPGRASSAGSEPPATKEQASPVR